MIKYYFGSPGCGKTTMAVKLALDAKKSYSHCVCNFENSVPGVFYDDMDKLGEYKYPENTLVNSDESSIKYNNRFYKNFPKALISLLKYHRHYGIDFNFFSQSWDDVDITIRRLTDELWYLRKLGPFTICRKVKKFVTVNDTDYQIIDGYKFCSPLWSILPPPFRVKTFEIVFRPLYYKYFDSYSDPCDLPVKDLSELKRFDLLEE